MNKFLFLLMTFVLNISQVYAVTIPQNMKQALKTTPDTPGLANIVASLIIVILLIYVVGWAYMRLSNINAKKIFKKANETEINKPKIISGIPLGQNRHLYVVELNNKYLAIGVTPNNINLIREFDKAEINKDEIIKNVISEDVKDNTENISDEMKIVHSLFGKDVKQENQQVVQEPKKDTELDDICKKYL